MLSLVPSPFLEEPLLQVHGLSYIYKWSVNHHNGSWGILEAPLPWCLNLLWPSIHEWLFFGLQGKCDPESCCRLPHWDSLLLTHYKIFHHLQFMYRSWQNKQVKRNAYLYRKWKSSYDASAQSKQVDIKQKFMLKLPMHEPYIIMDIQSNHEQLSKAIKIQNTCYYRYTTVSCLCSCARDIFTDQCRCAYQIRGH